MKKTFRKIIERIHICVERQFQKIFCRLNKKDKLLLKSNKKFKNLFLGKRCFIFGNGPSINSLNFANFKDEIVITVNQIARNKQFPLLKPSFHFWADPNFFNLDISRSENVDLIKQMENVKTNFNNPECFFPANFKSYLDSIDLDSLNKNYFLPSFPLEFFGHYKNNFSKKCPSFNTVVQYAILFANFLGCKEIYLLGVETTSILTSIKNRLDLELEGSYGYDISANEKTRIKELAKKVSFEEELYSNYRTIRDYKTLNAFCKKNGSILYNCTPVSLIEGIEHKDISKVIKENQG